MEVLQYLWCGQNRNLRYITALEDKVFDLTHNEITSIWSKLLWLDEQLNFQVGGVNILEEKLNEQAAEIYKLQQDNESHAKTANFHFILVLCLFVLVLCLVLERLCVYIY